MLRFLPWTQTLFSSENNLKDTTQTILETTADGSESLCFLASCMMF